MPLGLLISLATDDNVETNDGVEVKVDDVRSQNDNALPAAVPSHALHLHPMPSMTADPGAFTAPQFPLKTTPVDTQLPFSPFPSALSIQPSSR